MNIKYTIIDNANNPVKFRTDYTDGYILYVVPQNNCYQFLDRGTAKSELKHINKFINSDYYVVNVDKEVELPLRIAGVRYEISIFEI